MWFDKLTTNGKTDPSPFGLSDSLRGTGSDSDPSESLSKARAGGWMEMANETGKRYSCDNCGSEFVVTRGGEGTVSCGGKPMTKRS